MKKNARLFAGISAFMFIIPIVIFSVQCANAISDLKSFGDSVIEYARGSIVFELVMAVFIIITCLATLLMVYEYASERALYISTSVTLTFIIALIISDTFISIELLRKIYGDFITMPGIGIAKLVFLFLAVLLIFVGNCFRGTLHHEDKSNWFMIGALTCVFICCIFAFTSMNKDTSGLNIAFTILLTLSILTCVLEFLNAYIGNSNRIKKVSVNQTVSNSIPASTNQPEPKTSQETTLQQQASLNKVEVDPGTELRKLKSLLDDGVITTEEYEEKRKKYVDKL